MQANIEHREVDLPEKFARRLTKEAFAEWLRGRSAHVRAGTSDMPNGCPLALFIQACLGFPHAQVAGACTFGAFSGMSMTLPRLSEIRENATTHNVTIKVYHLPKWADEFVDAMDTGKLRRAVYPREALSILKRIKS